MTQEEANEKLIETLERLTHTLDNTHGSLSGLSDGFTTAGKNLEDLDPLQQADAKAKKDLAEKQQNVNRALYSADKALQKFGGAFMQNEKSFSKYSSSIESMGDAIANAVKLIPGIGQLASMAVKAVTAAAVATLKQTDNVLKAGDAMAQFGAAGALSSQQILEIGHRAGLSSDNLQVFTKAAAAAGPSLLSLGSTAGEGIIQFGKLTEVTSEQRQAFQALGVGQDELMENQAAYIKQQAASGVMITQEMITSGKVQKASLEYTENLLVLSALTGKSTKEIKDQQAVDAAQFAFRIKQGQLSQEAAEAEKEGTQAGKEKAAMLRKEIEMQTNLVSAARATNDAQQVLAIQTALATGSITKESAVLVNLGVDVGGLISMTKQGKNAADSYQTQAVAGVGRNLKQVGSSAVYSEGNAKALGLGGELVTFAIERMGTDISAAREKAVAQIGEPSKGIKGTIVAQDKARIAQNFTTEAEITGQVAMDKLVHAANPLIKGFESLTPEIDKAGKALGILADKAAPAAPAVAPARPMGSGGGGGSAPTGSAIVNPGKSVTIGDQKRMGGDRNWRNNNPGNIEYGQFAISMGAIGSDGRFAIFPTEEMGRKAADALLKGKNYANLSAADVIKKWAPPNENNTGSYISNLQKKTGLDMSRRYADMTPAEQSKFIDAMKGVEGGKSGTVSSVASDAPQTPKILAVNQQAPVQAPVQAPKVSGYLEGVASGPNTGYPAQLDGTELIKRLTPNSILDKLAYTPASAAETITTSTSDNSSKILGELYSLMEDKFDDLIDTIRVGNDTSDKLLKYSRV